METDKVWTADRKEAYDFAILVNVCDGVNRVKVKRDIDDYLYIYIGYELWAGEEICNILLINNFNGVNCWHTKGSIAEMLDRMRRV